MAKVINFKEVKERKSESVYKLRDFNVADDYVDDRELYNLFEDKDIYIDCESREVLFEKLTNVAKIFDHKRVAWIVIDKENGFFYIKEKDEIYTTDTNCLKGCLKDLIDIYAIDYVMLIQRISRFKYKKIMS